MNEKARALVVRGTDWSESSRITTLFTREYGKVRALAKGGRRLKSSFEISFDLLTVCDVVYLRKANSELDLLTEARVVEQFPILRRNLAALYAGYYVAELLAEGTADYDPHPELFDAALGLLRQLGVDAALRPARVLAFELAWLRELGYSPRLSGCATCGKPLPPEATRARYSPLSGGVVCSHCETPKDARWLSRAALDELETLGRRPLPPVLARELRSMMTQTVCHQLGRRPRLLSYLE